MRLKNILKAIGFDPHIFATDIKNTPRFLRDLRAFRAKSAKSEHKLPLTLKPMLGDFNEDAGVASGHYFLQDLWAARKIYERRPEKHLDIGSAVGSFVAHVLSFMPVTLIDIRPLSSKVKGLTYIQDDATDLKGFADDSVDSLSCLHAVEHFGLGRYGDPIDPEGSFKAMRAMARVLKPGGRLYLSMPVGRERVEFNSQRIISPGTVMETLKDLKLVSFSAVNDAGDFLENQDWAKYADSRYACGMFEFTKAS